MLKVATGALILIVSMILMKSIAFSCGGPWDVACNIGDVGNKAINDTRDTLNKAVDDTVSTGKKAIDDTVKTGDKAAGDISNTANKALDDTAQAVKKAVDDSIESYKKAIGDSLRTYNKAANDLIDAGKAAERFVEHEIHDQGQVLSETEKRLREGKVVDAIWGMGADQAKHTSDNAAKAAQESEVLNAAAQVAATAYGGPAGAAAYAAWYAYSATQNLELALRAGALAALSSEAGHAVSAMPTGTVDEVIQKAAVSGAVGGVAVAASGGDANAVRDGFIKAGGMVIVQSGQAYVKKEYGDPIAARADNYCMATADTSCKYVLPKLKHDAANAILQDANGNPIIDTSYIVDMKSSVKDWNEQAKGLDKIGDIPVILSDNKDWSISFSKNNFVDRSANLPSVVVTYVGKGSILQERQAAIQAAVDQSVPDAGAISTGSVGGNMSSPRYTGDQRWTAFNDISTSQIYFFHTNPNVRQDLVQVGDALRAKLDVSLYPRPAQWAAAPETLKSGSTVIVSSIQTLSDKEGHYQKWIEIESSSQSRGVGGDVFVNVEHTKTTEKRNADRIWCIDQQIDAAFEIRSGGRIRSLLTPIAGTVTKDRNGTMHLVVSKQSDNIFSAFLPNFATYESIVTTDGRLLRKLGPRSFVLAGTCTSVSELGSR